MSCSEFQSLEYTSFGSNESDGMQSEPSLASTVIFQGVDSVDHAITVDSGQIRFEFML